MASTYLSKTYGSSGNRQRQAISVWVKRAKLADTQTIFWSNGGASYYAHLRFKSDDTLQYYAHNTCNLKTNRKFRDTNAWLHICVTLDTPQATQSDRLKIYINGVAETSFSTATYPSQNAEVKFADDNIHYIGQSDSGSYFDGYMSHFHFVTNTAYAASTFGSTDSVTGEWQINPSPTVTYATNSFFVFKDGNSGTDQSGQGNNYSVANGTLLATKDCPSNVFAVVSNLDNYYPSSAFANGNLELTTNSSNYTFNNATLGYSSGKYYWEAKVASTSNYDHIGITENGSTGSQNYMYDCPHSYVLKSNNGVLKENTGSGQGTVSGFSGSSFTAGDYIGVAHDADNNKIYFSKNGTWMNSANPSTPTGGITTTAASSTNTKFWLPAFGDENNGTYTKWEINFGNGAFAATQLTGTTYPANANLGIFKYQPPTGFTALCTKGLNL